MKASTWVAMRVSTLMRERGTKTAASCPGGNEFRRGRLFANGVALLRRRSSWAAVVRCRRGSAALEFALASLPLMIILFGFIATNAIFLTLSAMQNNVQYAAMLMATGQITSFQSAPVACSGSLTSTQVEYHTCQSLPGWAVFTVTATQSCTAPASVTVKLTVSATSAGLADIFSFYAGKTLQALATNMKQGACP